MFAVALSKVCKVVPVSKSRYCNASAVNLLFDTIQIQTQILLYKSLTRFYKHLTRISSA